MQILPPEGMEKFLGKQIGCSDWFPIDQARIDKFAHCTLDNHWVHVDVESAGQGFFGKTIAQANLIVSLLTYFNESFMVVPEGAVMAIYYGMNKVRHLSPVTVDSHIRDRIVLARVEKKTRGRILITVNHTVEIKGNKKPACYAESLTLFFTR
ncbi:MAG: MaoC family dehydratase [Desulfobacteraceae bacterium]|nr:MaoC family dehydratase [Desulfobacteraceae bacterium]